MQDFFERDFSLSCAGGAVTLATQEKIYVRSLNASFLDEYKQ